MCRVFTGMPSLNISASHVGHARQHAFRNGAEVLILQLLALGRLGPEERPPAVQEVGAGVEEVLVDEEVFLLRADGGEHFLGFRVAEELQNAERLRRERFHTAKQRRLLVERLAGPRHEHGRDDERGPFGDFADVRGRSRIPAGVAAGFEGGADAAGGEAAGVRLALAPVPCR